MKAILMIEMPEYCEDCPCSQIVDYKDKEATFCFAKSRLNETLDKPEWCPLKPMPNKRGGDEWATGWNACIDELEEKR